MENEGETLKDFKFQISDFKPEIWNFKFEAPLSILTKKAVSIKFGTAFLVKILRGPIFSNFKFQTSNFKLQIFKPSIPYSINVN
jgi:hypothetical protein